MTTQPLHLLSDPADPIWPVLDRYLAGAATDADLLHVEAWRNAHPGRDASLRRWQNAWQYLATAELPNAETVHAVADGLLARAVATQRERRHEPVIRSAPRARFKWVATGL